MVEDQTKSSDRSKSITLNILDELLPKDAESGVGVRMWDGSLWPDEEPRDATIVLNHPGALKTMFSSMNARLIFPFFSSRCTMPLAIARSPFGFISMYRSA